LRWQEVAVPLAIVAILVALKYVPALAGLPLARLAGVVSFGYAAFLALRLLQSEEAIFIDGWSELRASPVELFGALAGGSLAVALLVGVLLGGVLQGSPTQMAAAFVLSVALAAVSVAILFSSVLVRVRWNQSRIERRDHRGRSVVVDWSEVRRVEARWGGVTIVAADKRRIGFSPLHSGAAQLARFAVRHARRNSTLPEPGAIWS
jgi:hypothetical protein